MLTSYLHLKLAHARVKVLCTRLQQRDKQLLQLWVGGVWLVCVRIGVISNFFERDCHRKKVLGAQAQTTHGRLNAQWSLCSWRNQWSHQTPAAIEWIWRLAVDLLPVSTGKTWLHISKSNHLVVRFFVRTNKAINQQNFWYLWIFGKFVSGLQITQ